MYVYGSISRQTGIQFVWATNWMVGAYLVFVQIVGQTADENFVRGIRYNGADDANTWCYCGRRGFRLGLNVKMSNKRFIKLWELPPEPIEPLSVMPGIG